MNSFWRLPTLFIIAICTVLVEITGSALVLPPLQPLGTADLPGNQTIEVGRYLIMLILISWLSSVPQPRALFRVSVPHALIPI